MLSEGHSLPTFYLLPSVYEDEALPLSPPPAVRLRAAPGRQQTH